MAFSSCNYDALLVSSDHAPGPDLHHRLKLKQGVLQTVDLPEKPPRTQKPHFIFLSILCIVLSGVIPHTIPSADPVHMSHMSLLTWRSNIIF